MQQIRPGRTDVMTEQEKKDVLTEIHRLTQNDFLNGNDLLYFFCEEYPIPTSEEVEEQRKKKRWQLSRLSRSIKP